MNLEVEQRFERIERKLEQVAEGLASLTAHAGFIDGTVAGLATRMDTLAGRMDQQTERMVRHDILLSQLMEAQLRTESSLDRLSEKVDRLTGKVDEIDRRGGK